MSETMESKPCMRQRPVNPLALHVPETTGLGAAVIDCPVFGTGEAMQLTVNRWLARTHSAFQEITIVDTVEFDRCLLLDGVMQSAISDHLLYDDGLLAPATGSERHLAVLGGGDGFVASRAVSRWPELQVTVVEIDPDVTRLCEQLLNPGVFDHPRIELCIADAVHFAEDAVTRGAPRFDSAIIDLTDVPVAPPGAGSVEEFYERIISSMFDLLPVGGWISVQSGTPAASGGHLELASIVARILRRHVAAVERREVYLPSYGEAAVLLSARKGQS